MEFDWNSDWNWTGIRLDRHLCTPSSGRPPLTLVPSRRPVGTVRDRAQIGTKTARTSPDPISGLRLPRHGAQAGGGPSAIEYCSRRFDGGLQNGILAFRAPWYPTEPP